MNNWICPKCNLMNAAAEQSCRNCGLPSNYVNQSETDLPATVIGFSPPAPNQFQAQNQQNYAQNQSAQLPPHQQQPYQQQMPPQQASYSQPSAPKKSHLKKILVIGGLFGFIVVVISGVVLWFAVINPYLEKQARLKKEWSNQFRANMMAANSLLPSESTIYQDANSFKRNKTFDKLQLFQASQNLSPELKEQIKDINDAAAAEYVSTSNSNQKFVVQIFKYNSPEQARSTCVKITQELKKNEALFKSVYSYPNNLNDSPSSCHASAQGKNNESTDVKSLYGFLWISSGHKDFAPTASTEVNLTLTR